MTIYHLPMTVVLLEVLQRPIPGALLHDIVEGRYEHVRVAVAVVLAL